LHPIDERPGPVRKLAFLLVLLNFYSWPGPERGQSAEWEAANRADPDAVIAETPSVPILKFDRSNFRKKGTLAL
jgi:hypothetical protein